jgi:addiction module HigA family antidote
MKSAAKIITDERSLPRDPASLGPVVHPGEMLLEEFLKPLELTQRDAARELGVSANRLNEIIIGKRGVTADTAIRLSERFGMTPQFWMHLQGDWDLHVALNARGAAAGRGTRSQGKRAPAAGRRKTAARVGAGAGR